MAHLQSCEGPTFARLKMGQSLCIMRKSIRFSFQSRNENRIAVPIAQRMCHCAWQTLQWTKPRIFVQQLFCQCLELVVLNDAFACKILTERRLRTIETLSVKSRRPNACMLAAVALGLDQARRKRWPRPTATLTSHIPR